MYLREIKIRQRKKGNRDEKDPSKHALDPRTGEDVFSDDAARECREKGIDPRSLNFICHGKSTVTGERCRACLTLCSASEYNIPASYFAHRGKGRDHIENCDCRGSYRTLEISRTLNRSVSKTDLSSFVNILYEDNSGREGRGGGGGVAPPVDPPSGKEKVDGNAQKIERFVKPNSPAEFYEVIAMGVARTPEAKTADGVRLEEQIINSTTFEKYRREELPLSGPKLIVTSNKLVYPGDIEDIKIKLDDAFWVLLDPYIDDSSGKRLYYVLCAEDKKSIYLDKTTYQRIHNIGITTHSL